MNDPQANTLIKTLFTLHMPNITPVNMSKFTFIILVFYLANTSHIYGKTKNRGRNQPLFTQFFSRFSRKLLYLVVHPLIFPSNHIFASLSPIDMCRGGDSDTRKTQLGFGGSSIIPAKRMPFFYSSLYS